MNNNPTIKERLTRVETLLDHIVKNDLLHIKIMLYALIASVLGYIVKSVFF